ncbi:aldehyde dehydrogenase family protein, partial [Klebsiella aerogenes]
IYDRVVDEAKAVAESLVVDSSHKPGNHIGPLASEAQFQKVQEMIQKGIEEGARLIAGGLGRPEGHEQGY